MLKLLIEFCEKLDDRMTNEIEKLIEGFKIRELLELAPLRIKLEEELT